MEIIQKHARSIYREPHRSEYEIINDILVFVSSSDTISGQNRKRCKPIDIVYGCCLTWHQFQVYRDHLLRIELLNYILTDGRPAYEITDRGLEYLRLFSELQAEMKPLVDILSDKT